MLKNSKWKYLRGRLIRKMDLCRECFVVVAVVKFCARVFVDWEFSTVIKINISMCAKELEVGKKDRKDFFSI